MIRSDMYAEGRGGVLEGGFEAAENPLWIVNPTEETLSQLVATFRKSPPPAARPVRLFAGRGPLKTVADDFLLSSRAAELVAKDRLAVRTLSSVPQWSLLLTEQAVVSLVECEDCVAGLTTTRDGFVEATHEEYTTRWEQAEQFSFRTPPLSEIRTTLESDIGPAVVEDFNRALAALKADRDGLVYSDGVLDEVAITLLVAANNGELLYDISRWGEDIRLASKATFSRTKKRLEDVGLVDTEKVPIDVGRPRLRLVLGKDCETGKIEQLVRRARRALE